MHDFSPLSSFTYQSKWTASVQLAAVLRKLQDSEMADALANGREVPVWVFTNGQGKPCDDAWTGKAFRRTLKAAKLPLHLSPHSLRHSYASILLQQGSPQRTCNGN